MYLKFLLVLDSLVITLVTKIDYLCANFVNELLCVNGVVCLSADHIVDDSVGLLVDKFFKVVENCLVDFAHVKLMADLKIGFGFKLIV